MILDYFKQICQIPHVSFHEQQLSDYCVAFAQKHQLRYVQDAIGNLVIYKPASPGYEHCPVTMLQAHLDMVGAKSTTSNHNFLTDPIKLIEQEGWLHAENTSLGADDGVGVAYMLEILADNTLKHPALECVFTVQEEVGLLGALQFDASVLSAKYCIGLDCAGEHLTTVSCTGGLMGTLTKKMDVSVQYDTTLQIHIKGMKGGHAGIDIGSERGNAIKVASVLLYEMSKVASIGVADVRGGDKNNAIPRECKMVLGVLACDQAVIEETMQQVMAGFAVMFEHSAPELDVVFSFAKNPISAASVEASRTIIEMLYLLPSGYFIKSALLPDLVLSSNNVGVVRVEEGQLLVDFYLRSPQPFMIQQTCNTIDIICKNAGCEVSYYNAFPGWNYETTSPLRELLVAVHHDLYGHDMVFDSTHGGMELGVWKANIPGVDIVNLGPIMEDFHSPQERLNLESFHRTYRFLTTLLKRIGQ